MTVSLRRSQASRQPSANRCPPLLQGISVAVSGMHRGEEVRFGPIHSPELPHERVLPQLLLCQHPLLQPLLQIPKPQGLPQVYPEPIHLLWEEVSAVLTLALQHFPPLGAVKVKTEMSVDHGRGGVTQTRVRMPIRLLLADGLGPQLISLGLSFICKMKTTILTLKDCSENYKALRAVLGT